MIYFDGTYRIKAPGDIRAETGQTWANTWRVRLIDFSLGCPDVCHLKPVTILATLEGSGLLRVTCAERLGPRILRDFSLDACKVRWVESDPDRPDRLFAASFEQTRVPAPMPVYTVRFRPILQNEFDAVSEFMEASEGFRPPEEG